MIGAKDLNARDGGLFETAKKYASRERFLLRGQARASDSRRSWRQPLSDLEERTAEIVGGLAYLMDSREDGGW